MFEMAKPGGMAVGLATAYGAKVFDPHTLNRLFSDHIEHLKSSEIEIHQTTGRVLDGATTGFGLGYTSSTIIIAAGQLMLGNTFHAVVTVGSSAVFANPAAATCAAVGALYYGYRALTDDEQERFLTTLREGFDVGVELIKAMISFVENTLTKMLDSEMLKALRKLVAEYAQMFGKSFADITKSVNDRVVLLAHQAATAAYDASNWVGNAIYDGATTTSEFGSNLSANVKAAGEASGSWASDKSQQVKLKLLSVFQASEESEKPDERH